MVYIRANSKSKLKVLAPLIMFDDKAEFSPKVNEIYKKSSTHSIKCEI